MLLRMRVIREFSQRKSQRLLSCNKNGKRRGSKILTWPFSHLLLSHLLEKCFYLSRNGDGERAPSPMMQEGSLWTMVNFMLCSTEYKSVQGTWNSVEYGHGVWAFLFGSVQRCFLSKSFLRQGQRSLARNPSSHQLPKKDCWDVLIFECCMGFGFWGNSRWDSSSW